ncbi:VPEID-CTERM protein sorting domain-containing protein [Roseovarius marisflavi]|uniref:VPEID-CTERM protein sorting domain-containing protein n=1 Tax=Roseovarius marisflavi TaxID=1054996 RepID=A0A1M6V0N0_9RHOB|nr:VPEID-CTERM sorting domain-containing protein [Roseovarius marisflavi]SHK75049.1 VPEID-CTERM protein sorting domain-containing protein [Roseovarius marisflavi]
MWDWFTYYYGGSTGDSGGSTSTASSVPEMDAASGTLAIAVVLAALVLAWEIKRRTRA